MNEARSASKRNKDRQIEAKWLIKRKMIICHKK
jgi:hypothetical protein